MKAIADALQDADAGLIREAFRKGEPYYLDIAGSSYKITEEDLVFSIVERTGWPSRATASSTWRWTSALRRSWCKRVMPASW
jgi:hypothetical protein